MKLFIVLVLFIADTVGKTEFLIANVLNVCEYSISLKFIQITHEVIVKLGLDLTK